MMHLIYQNTSQSVDVCNYRGAPTFCLRQAAHALTFLEMPGSLLVSAGVPFVVELVR